MPVHIFSNALETSHLFLTYFLFRVLYRKDFRFWVGKAFLNILRANRGLFTVFFRMLAHLEL